MLQRGLSSTVIFSAALLLQGFIPTLCVHIEDVPNHQAEGGDAAKGHHKSEGGDAAKGHHQSKGGDAAKVPNRRSEGGDAAKVHHKAEGGDAAKTAPDAGATCQIVSITASGGKLVLGVAAVAGAPIVGSGVAVGAGVVAVAAGTKGAIDAGSNLLDKDRKALTCDTAHDGFKLAAWVGGGVSLGLGIAATVASGGMAAPLVVGALAVGGTSLATGVSNELGYQYFCSTYQKLFEECCKANADQKSCKGESVSTNAEAEKDVCLKKVADAYKKDVESDGKLDGK